jgi:hypothetical protein
MKQAYLAVTYIDTNMDIDTNRGHDQDFAAASGSQVHM